MFKIICMSITIVYRQFAHGAMWYVISFLITKNACILVYLVIWLYQGKGSPTATAERLNTSEGTARRNAVVMWSTAKPETEVESKHDFE